MKKWFHLILLTILLGLLLLSLPAFAAFGGGLSFIPDFEARNDYSPPIGYEDGADDRTYSRKTFALFNFDDGYGERAIGWTDQMCSFDNYEKLKAYSSEWTGAAALPTDEIIEGAGNYLKKSFLDVFNWPTIPSENGDRYYYKFHDVDLDQIFPSWYGGGYFVKGNPNDNFNFYTFDLAKKVERNPAGANKSATGSNPQKLGGKPADKVYANEVSLPNGKKTVHNYAISFEKEIFFTDMQGYPQSFTAGWWDITETQAKTYHYQDTRGQGRFHFTVYFDYDIGMIPGPGHTQAGGVELISVGRGENAKDRYRVTVFNNLPYDAINVKLRAYALTENREPVLVAETTLPKLRGLGGGWDNGDPKQLYNWEFESPVMGEDYQIIATTNMYWGGSSWIPENLITEYRNSGGKKAHGDLGVPEKRSSDRGIGVGVTGKYIPDMKNLAYMNNWVTSKQMVGDSSPPSDTESKPNDLSVQSLTVLDATNDQRVTSVQANQPLKIQAVFNSTFPEAGWVKLRLYKHQINHNRLDQVGDTVTAHMDANGGLVREWSGLNIGTGEYAFVASINAINDGNDPNTDWEIEKFTTDTGEEFKEADYDTPDESNNKLAYSLTGSDAPPREPQPVVQKQSVWFPPLKWELVEEYRTETIDIYGWREVEFIKDPTKARIITRLVPNVEKEKSEEPEEW